MPKSLDASKGRATLPRHPYHVTTGTAPAVPGPESGGPSNAHNDDDDVNMDSDPDYTSVTEGAKPIHRRRKRAYNPSLRKLDRKQRALCRELHFRQQRQSRDLAKIFSVTEATIKRVVYNEYANSGKDNLDSDHEYIKDGDVLRKLTQLDRLPTRMPTCAASSRGSKCTSVSTDTETREDYSHCLFQQRGAIRPSPPTSSKRGRPAKAEKAPVRPAGMASPSISANLIH
ncbi:hypothetical protein BS17DRAFT_559146 [Gyrodon lividus]|nr:hypothetical protein BS17DRAFT_559146 [Gyrodon lividus]